MLALDALQHLRNQLTEAFASKRLRPHVSDNQSSEMYSFEDTERNSAFLPDGMDTNSYRYAHIFLRPED